MIAGDPQAGKPLGGPLRGRLSCRVGDWRIVYQVEDGEIYVATVAHRGRAYR